MATQIELPDDLVRRFDDWLANRNEVSEAAENGTIGPDDWAHSDDDAVDIVHSIIHLLP